MSVTEAAIWIFGCGFVVGFIVAATLCAMLYERSTAQKASRDRWEPNP